MKHKVEDAKNQEQEKSFERVEKYIGGRKTKEAWNVIKSLRQDQKDKNVDMINIDQWQQYFSKILNEERKERIFNEVKIAQVSSHLTESLIPMILGIPMLSI